MSSDGAHAVCIIVCYFMNLSDFAQGEMLASAGDDGNVLLWVPSDHHGSTALGDDTPDDRETWTVKRMCRSSSGAEIYDLAWSPDGAFFITGSMDNVARIFSAETGTASNLTQTDLMLMQDRPNRSTDSRAPPLRPGRRLGSSERVPGDPVLRPIRSRIRLEDQRWAILPLTTW